MRLATIKLHGAEIAGIVTGKGILPVAALNAYKGTGWKEDMMSLIQANHIPGLTKWYNEGGKEELETIPGGGRLRPALPQPQAHLRHRPQLRRPCQGHRQRRAHGLPRQLLQDGRYPHRPE